MSENGIQTKMHENEISIDTDLVQRLLVGQFPHLAERPLDLVRSTGTVNALYRLGHDLYVRLPRMGEWADSLDREWVWLRKLAPKISLEIPQPVALGKPSEYFPYSWAIYHWIEGTPYQSKENLDETQTARDLANFIKELRGVDKQNAPRGGRAPLIKLDAETCSAIKSIGMQENVDALIDIWNFSLKAKLWKNAPVWIHGDLIKPNLLVREGQIKAIIDFGSVGIGDPAADIVPAWSVFNSVGRKAFRQELDVDDDTWYRARGYALHQAVMIIPYYSGTNPAFVSMAKDTIDQILSEFH